MILTKSRFKTSVNIKLDLGSSWIQERYIPTPTHVDSLTGILEGFLGKGNNSHILIGSYGSGKSMIGTLISNIVSKEVENNDIDLLIEKFNRVNIEENAIRELLQKIKGLKKRYIPVVINGRHGSFREVVLASIYKALKTFTFDFSLPTAAETIKTTINIWKEQFPETYMKFDSILQGENWSIEKYLAEIEEYDNNTINFFKEIFPSLSAGAEFSISYNVDFVEHLSYILNKLNENGYGLFLVYDEFGRFLQGLDKYETVEAMQDIQDLAELADHHESRNLNVLLITHRNLKQYFLSYSEELQNEFQRIQGRYKIYHTHSDPATFIRLSSQITEEYRVNFNNEYKYENQIVKYDLFPELNGREIKSIIVKNSYPLHPITMFTLPRLANAVAQNERTLFTFLESNEQGGLKKYYEVNKSWYYAHNLFDYFEPAFHEFMSDTLIGDAYYKYLRVRKKVENSKTAEFEIRLLKLITLWDIANLGNNHKLDKEFMAFALDWELIEVDEIISVLEEKKLIRYRYNGGNWEIFEGSSIDITKKIEEVKKNGISKQKKIELISSVIENRFAYPKQYNDEKNIIRYGTIHPIYASDLLNNSIKEFTIDHVADIDIFYVIPDQDPENAKKLIMELSRKEDTTLFSIPQYELTNLDEQLSTLASICTLLEDKYFLSEDSIVEEELLKLKENVIYLVKENLKPFTHFNNSNWLYKGNILNVKSRISLSDHLSNIMWEIYNQTPVINNEAFNRRKISKQQLNAAKEVVDSILAAEGRIDSLKGPSKLIYASIVKNNKVNENEEKVEIQALRQELMDVLREGNGDFTTLLDIFKSRPYGIREPNIPILLTSMLKREWKSLMFYHKDGSYINELDGSIFYDRFLDKPENYSFSFHTIGNDYKKVITNIENLFSSYMDENDMTYHPAVRMNRILSRWFRNLPKITQKTNNLSKDALLFKQLIKKGEFEPDIALGDMNELLVDINTFQLLKGEIEKYCKKHEDKLKSRIFKLVKVKNYKELYELVQDKDEVIKVDNKVYNVINKSSEENWIDDLALELVGVKRNEWSDATDVAFSKTIESLLKIENEKYLTREYHEIKLDDKSLAIPKVDLSSKGEIIYSNIKTNLDLMARRLPKDEIKSLLYKLLVDYYDENR
jgi:hypothetical protein